jgi:KUP system potassium uptake protein
MYQDASGAPGARYKWPAMRGRMLPLTLGAIGVVYGDIGTSPLYAIKECVSGPHAVTPTHGNVLGILSLIFWSITLVVSIKYLLVITRADNHGEGGILALFARIIPRGEGARSRTVVALGFLGLFGAGLLVADGLITPPISVLGAMEGLELRADSLHPLVVPLTIGVLVALFVAQRFGTGGIGKVFGPVMVLWFVSISVTGMPAVLRHPEVIQAVNPVHAVRFFVSNQWHGFFLLGAVVLSITGAEALYADMGHFGRRPIQIGWFALAKPALLINYFGQGALLLEDPAAAANPFYSLTPDWTLYAMMVLATMAAVIASQALISGVFSLVRQAAQLGYFPRVRIVHTSARDVGQIYIPEVNWLLLAGCIGVVVGFGSSSAMAAAYGIAITLTMAITSILFDVVARRDLKWPAGWTHALTALFLIVDLSMFAANANKIGAGGWLPLAIGVALFLVMITWRHGRRELGRVITETSLPLELFIADAAASGVPRVPGTAVFMTSTVDVAPTVLLHFFKHAKVVHEQVVLLSVLTDHVPKVPSRDMLEVTDREHGFFQVTVHVGFMQDPDIPAILAQCRREGLRTQPDQVSYFLGRETLLTSGHAPMARWRKALFAFLSRNARPATSFFHLPPNRVVELGAQIEL